MKAQKINWCKEHGLKCDKKEYPVTNIDKKYLFCCKQGYNDSMEKFHEYMNKK